MGLSSRVFIFSFSSASSSFFTCSSYTTRWYSFRSTCRCICNSWTVSSLLTVASAIVVIGRLAFVVSLVSPVDCLFSVSLGLPAVPFRVYYHWALQRGDHFCSRNPTTLSIPPWRVLLRSKDFELSFGLLHPCIPDSFQMIQRLLKGI